MEKILPVSMAEARALFADLATAEAIALAVSGGPDSTALLFLAARWAASLRKPPKLLAVTVDHRLRPESAREARAVAALARRLGVAHRVLRWTGRKPAAGLPAAARDARYRMLAAAARKAGARHVLTAHTLDDQAETVLLRMMRGSGLGGLAAMARVARLPGETSGEIALVRPLLDVPKARLIATLRRAGIAFADDPSNRDPRFTRARLRGLMPELAREGLTAGRLALLARRLRRADDAIAAAMQDAAVRLSAAAWVRGEPVVLDREGFRHLPAEVALRLLGRAIDHAGDEGPVELAKLEALYAALPAANGSAARFRRTLAGALVTWARDGLVIERAPARRRRPALTKSAHRAATFIKQE